MTQQGCDYKSATDNKEIGQNNKDKKVRDDSRTREDTKVPQKHFPR